MVRPTFTEYPKNIRLPQANFTLYLCGRKNHILTLKLSVPTLTTAILPLDRPVEIVAVEPNTVVLATNIPFAVYTAIFVPEGIPLIESILPMEGCHIRL